MSIAMGRNRIEPSGFRDGGEVASGAVLEAPEIGKGKEEKDEEEEEEENWSSSSATSSIGRNSDQSERSSTNGDDVDDNEVQSAYNGPFHMMNSLEEVLPIRRGISSFYNGKSKSFTSLAEASSTSSIKDIAKQENAYSRRRRNLLAINHIWDKNRRSCSPHRTNAYGMISKRPLSSSKSSLALAVAMSSSESLTSTSDDSNSRSPPPPTPPPLPPLHPRSKPSPWRSYSVADLQQCRKEATANASYCSYSSDKTEGEKPTYD